MDGDKKISNISGKQEKRKNKDEGNCMVLGMSLGMFAGAVVGMRLMPSFGLMSLGYGILIGMLIGMLVGILVGYTLKQR